MEIHRKFIVTCEKKDKGLIDKIFRRTKDFEVWAPHVINGFTDRVNSEIYKIISIKPTNEKMEIFGR